MTELDPTDLDRRVARVDTAVARVREATPLVPALGVVAGSGLSALGDLIDGAVRLPFRDIPGMHAPTVAGHKGELVLGHLEGLPIAVLAGRVHLYEGHPMDDVVFGVRMLARLGTPRVLLTNAAGGIHPWLEPGTLVRITDQLNLTGRNALVGPNISEFGPRFPDMSKIYGAEMSAAIAGAAADAGVSMANGVYAGMLGPSYETPAEIRMLNVLGAATVGMSTVHEAIALRHVGVEVGGISVVSNFAAGVSAELLDHADVAKAAVDAMPKLLAVVRHLARRLATEAG